MLRRLAKRLLLLPFLAWAWLFVVRTWLLRPFVDRDRAFELVSEALARRPGVTGLMLRRAFYGTALPRCGPDCTFAAGVILTKAGIRLGRNVTIGLQSIVSAAEIGSDVMIGPGVIFLSGREQHGTSRLDLPMVDQPGTYRTVHVGDDVWIGAGAVVMDDVGHGAVVAAGAVVVAPVPPYAIAAGNPARVVGHRTPNPPEVAGRPSIRP